TLAERVRHVVQAAFNGRRIVIFSGGAAAKDEQVFDEVRAIRDGGGFGSIIGRNSFQRKKPEALKFLATVMGIYAGTQKYRDPRGRGGRHQDAARSVGAGRGRLRAGPRGPAAKPRLRLARGGHRTLSRRRAAGPDRRRLYRHRRAGGRRPRHDDEPAPGGGRAPARIQESRRTLA